MIASNRFEFCLQNYLGPHTCVWTRRRLVPVCQLQLAGLVTSEHAKVHQRSKQTRYHQTVSFHARGSVILDSAHTCGQAATNPWATFGLCHNSTTSLLPTRGWLTLNVILFVCPKLPWIVWLRISENTDGAQGFQSANAPSKCALNRFNCLQASPKKLQCLSPSTRPLKNV